MPLRMLCAPRVNDTFGWSDQLRLRFGLVPRDSDAALVQLDAREQAAERVRSEAG